VEAFGDAERDALDLDRTWQQVAVVRDHPERDARGGVARIGEEELVEAGRPGVEDAETVAAFLHLEEGLDLPVDEELVAQEPVEAEQVEAHEPRGRVDQPVREEQRDVERGKAGETKARELEARVELVEVEMEARQALVGVLRRVLDAMVVIP